MPDSRSPFSPVALTLAGVLGLATPTAVYAAGAGGTGYASGQPGGTSYGGNPARGEGGTTGSGGLSVAGSAGWPMGAGGVGGANGSAVNGSGGSGASAFIDGRITIGAGAFAIGGGGGSGGVTSVHAGTPTASGGDGGTAVILTGGASSRDSANAGVIVGGGGGGAGAIAFLAMNSVIPDHAHLVQGGNGGDGLQWARSDSGFVNTGEIWGGGGGGGGSFTTVLSNGVHFRSGLGGAGGAGVVMSGDRLHLVNQGGIYGGNGGGGASSGSGGAGLLVAGKDSEIVQDGVIEGGRHNGRTLRAQAIGVAGSGNTLILMEGSTTTGDVLFTGANNRLRIGGGATASVAIDGAVSFGAGGVFSVRATPAAFDRLTVSGNAVLTGAAVEVLAAPGAYGEQFSQVVLSAGDTFNGTRFTGATSNLAYLTPSLSYSADDTRMMLTLVRKTEPGEGSGVVPGGTTEGAVPGAGSGGNLIRFGDLVSGGNARAVADAVETMPASNPVYSAAINLPAGAPQGFFSALSGEAHAGVASGLSNLSTTVRNVPLDQLRSNLNAGAAPGVPTAAAGANDVAPSAAVMPSSLARPAWARVVGNWQRLGATSDTSAMRQHTGGVFAGADHAVGAGWRLGGALGYTDSRLNVDDLASQADVSSYSAVLYGGKAYALGAGKLNVMAGASYTWHDIGTERRIAVGGLDQTLTADYGASTTQLFTEVSYAMGVARSLTLEPYAGVAWAGQRMRGFSESGGSAALSGASDTSDTTTTSLGLRAAQEVALGALAGTVTAGLGWRHAFGDVRPESRLAFNAGEAFTVTGAPIARDAALLEAGVHARVGRNTTLGLAYAGQFGGGNRDQTGTINLRWAF